MSINSLEEIENILKESIASLSGDSTLVV